jgi:coiled-coil and C2 domain-containing protein 1
MFDARCDLQSPSLHLSHCQGSASEQEDELTTLELMVQWMATIHSTLLNKHSFNEECNEDMEKYPRILSIGTHGDDAKGRSRDDIFRPLTEACKNTAFAHLLRRSFIVDNTTAGEGDDEDPTYQQIRTLTEKFTKDLIITTPITWVFFRKAFELYSKEKPVVGIDEVKELASACLIPEDTLISVLAFYHDLSVFFHYADVPSLKSKVIANPQWLVKQIANIAALEGFEEVKSEDLWRLLREKGILVAKLYKQVFSTQKELQPQDIVDLLEHFLIISPRIYILTKAWSIFFHRCCLYAKIHIS